jgi:hypothetical protein
MSTLRCSKEGCTAYFTSDELPLHKMATYTCKDHTAKSSKNKVRFQTSQFDKDLNRAGTPIGTTHIPGRQGASRPAGFRPGSALEIGEEEDA